MTAPQAILIAGPTASGKSALAVALAERVGGAVVNADSMQVYAELSILTARPGDADLARAPHALYGHVPATEPYSVGRWLEDAGREIVAAQSAERVPIVVGGTGLYFEALLNGLSPVPPIPPAIRARWRAQAQRLGPERLHAELAGSDPAMAARLRPSDPQRLTRALEVLEATGRSLAVWQAEVGAPVVARDQALCLVLAPERATLYARCEARFDDMLAAGALAEAEALMAQKLPPSLPAMRATGLRELMAHLRGELTLAQATEAAKAETRRYAKRQETWIKSRMAGWTRVAAGDGERAAREAVAALAPWSG